MSAGIVSFGGYVPSKRIARAVFAEVWGGRAASGERAICNHDEDSITMAVAAARDVLAGQPADSVDAYYFASTTAPYAEKAASSIIALATDMRRDVETADFANTLRCGSAALKAALRAVDAGALKRVLVTGVGQPPGGAGDP